MRTAIFIAITITLPQKNIIKKPLEQICKLTCKQRRLSKKNISCLYTCPFFDGSKCNIYFSKPIPMF